jgi:serine/threonine protein kinase/class 3 adenylate cyclase
LRLANLLQHAGALGIRALCLDGDPPFVVLEWLEATSLAGAYHQKVPLPVPDVLDIGSKLATVLAEAHRLGLVHGSVCLSEPRVTGDGRLVLDFTGLETSTPTDSGSAPEVETSGRPPEQGTAVVLDAAADVFSAGAVLFWLLHGRCAQPSGYRHDGGTSPSATLPTLHALQADAGEGLNQLLAEMLAAEPSERPSAKVVGERLAALREVQALANASGSAGAEAPQGSQTPEFFQQLGRYRILELLGVGGLGKVFRAEDMTDGTIVALKVLHTNLANREMALRRLHKEARLLAEVNNPYVANLIAINEDNNVHYLVLEYVPGTNLAKFLADRGRLEEPLAVHIMADVARGLVEAHHRGIVHRDIKPENILLVTGARGQGSGVSQEDPSLTLPARTVADASGSARALTPGPRVKLSDFGLARHVVQSESLEMTQAGAILGTPLYMAPEQCSGAGVIDPRTDVYAMGVTLFHLLAGQPPFQAESVLALTSMHVNEPPPPLQKLNPRLSDGVCRIVAKALAKLPDARHADAEALLLDLERLERGELTSIAVHPRLPACDPDRQLQYDWSWDLQASPEQLWPYVSNTERLNRAVGLPAVEFTSAIDPAAGVLRFGKFRKAGFTNVWQEHPFEWIEARRMGVLRVYSQGVFKWLASMTELEPRAGGGTTLSHRVRIEPAGMLGRLVAAVEVGVKGRRSVERVYRRIDAFVTGTLGRGTAADPFEIPASPSADQRLRVKHLVDKLVAAQVEPAVAQQLGAFLLQQPDQEVARIRPLVLARRLGLDSEQVVNACLVGAREGLLVMLWDILCPLCRIPSDIKDTLRELRTHGHCEACNLNFELDFANSVEMIFRAHPEIRATELGTFCIGGPAHSPHVVAQVRLHPGEPMELELKLAEGSYRLRGPQLPYALDFRVQPAATQTRWDLRLAQGLDLELPPTLRAGRQLLMLTNDYAHEVVVRVERNTHRDDALTAARASTLALFRQLFPGEVLSPGQLVSVATVTLLVTDLDQAANLYQTLGDAQAFGILHEHFRFLNEVIGRRGGALVKTLGEGVLAAFNDPLAAVQVGLDLLGQRGQDRGVAVASASGSGALPLRVAIHRGPAMAATVNDHLDYFGTTVNQATRLPELIRAGEVALSHAVTSDPRVTTLLSRSGLALEVVPADLPGVFIQRVIPAA